MPAENRKVAESMLQSGISSLRARDRYLKLISHSAKQSTQSGDPDQDLKTKPQKGASCVGTVDIAN